MAFVLEPSLSHAHCKTFGNHFWMDLSIPLKQEGRSTQASQNTVSHYCAFCLIQGCVPSFLLGGWPGLYFALLTLPQSQAKAQENAVERHLSGHGEQVCGPIKKKMTHITGFPVDTWLVIRLLQTRQWDIDPVALLFRLSAFCWGDWLTAGILIFLLCWSRMTFFDVLSSFSRYKTSSAGSKGLVL